MRPPTALLRLLRDAGKAAAARGRAASAACVQPAEKAALQAAQATSAMARDPGEASGSSVGWWAAAGAGVLLGQGLWTAHAEEQQPPEASVSGAQPPDLVSNKSTAQWRLYTNMGHEHFRKGDVDSAERYLVRALEEARRGFGAADGHVAAACNNLAELYRNAGRPGQAEPLYQEALCILEAAYGRGDPRYATAAQHLAGFLRQQGRFGAARRQHRLALEALEASLGGQHPAYAAALLQLADLERAVDDLPQAAALLRQALAVLDALGPPSAEDALQAANRLGQVLVLSGQHAEGLAVLRRCVQQAESLGEQLAAADGSPGGGGGSGRAGQGQALLLLHVGSLAEALLKSGDLEAARDGFHRALSLGSGEGPRRALLPGLLLSCAEAELRLGDATARRDSWLRAHNLALQATEDYRSRWRQLAALRARRSSAAAGWLERLLGAPPDAEAAAVEASPATVALCHQWARAHALLARVQERLGRVPEARQALAEALAVLRKPAAAPAKGQPGRPLDAATGAREPWVQAQVLHLQILVEVLYSLLRLTADDGVAAALPGVRGALAELGARLPGLSESREAGPPGVDGLTPLGCRAWAARQRLNALQAEINRLRRQDAAAESER